MKKNYRNWLKRLVNKITSTKCPNNNNFLYYGHKVVLQSGTCDYVNVTISTMDDGNITCFSFDFWTKELCFEAYADYDERDTIISAFRRIYGCLSVTDEPWKEEEQAYLPMLNNKEYDQETIINEYNDLLSHKIK